MGYTSAGFGPKYLKVRTVKKKKGVGRYYCVRAERRGRELQAQAPQHLTKEKDLIRWAELVYSRFVSDEAKPATVKDAEVAARKSGMTFAETALRIEELTAGLSDEYNRKVPYHMRRLRQYFDVHCTYLKDWTDNKWPEYVAFRRAQNPICQLNHDKRQLCRILNYAYNEGVIPKKPKLKNLDSDPEHGRCLEEWELVALYGSASPELRDEIELGVRMAFRQIDVDNLTTDRVDFKRNIVSFRRGARSGEGGQKNRKAVEIQLNPVCREMLLRRLGGLKGHYFFPNARDPNRPKRTNKTAWYAACRRAGIKASFHDLRHTCATLMARSGLAEAFTQKYCRMSAPVVRNIYTHLEGVDNVRAANAIVVDWSRK